MLRRLIAWSINHSQLVLVAAAALLVLAGGALATMPVDVFPELNAPTVVVLTEAGGLTAEEVEQRVSHPIESSMTGLPGVRRVRSASATSLSLIWVEFDWAADIYRARQLVAEKLAGVREALPDNAHAELGPISSLAGEVMLLALSSPDGTVNPMELRSIAEFQLRPGLLAVSGVSQVVAIGGLLPEYQVHVDPDQLMFHGLTLSDVAKAAGKSHSTTSGGYLTDVAGREQPVQQIAQVRTPEDIGSTTVTSLGKRPIALREVAKVGMGGAPRRGAASHDGHAAVVLSIQRSPNVNTLALDARIDEALDRLVATLPKGVALDRHAFRQSRFINASVDNLQTVVTEAVIIVAVVLMLFLMNFRATLITLTALPLSLAAAILAMWALGMSINVMTIGGLAVAIGALVDDAIIDVENVVRRLNDNGARPASERRPFLEVLFTASDEIRSSVVFATVIICVVFIPLLLMQGLEGRFFRPLGFAYIVAVMASLVVALTVTPALCRHLLKPKTSDESQGLDAPGETGAENNPEEGGRLVRVLLGVYRPTLDWALRRRGLVVGATLVLTFASIALASTFGSSFLPSFNEGSLTVFVTAPPGTSLVESDRISSSVEKQLVGLTGVRGVTRRTGRAERDEHAEPVWSSELDVTIAEGHTKADVAARVDVALEAVKGVTTTVGQPIEHRLSHILSGTPAALAINIYGDDLAVLRKVASVVEDAMNDVEGTRDVAANREVLVDAVPIAYDREALRHFGLTPAEAAEQVGAAVDGAHVSEVRDGFRNYRLMVRIDEQARRSAEDLGNLVLRGSDDRLVRLRDVARVYKDQAPYLIARQDGRRKAVVSANIEVGSNLGHVVEAVQKVVDPIAASFGVTVEYGGQFQAQKSASKSLLFSGIAVLFLVGLLLKSTLGSVRATLLVGVNLPLGLIGGIVAVFIAESPDTLANLGALFTGGKYQAPVVSVASLVGFVTLFGIAVRNGILLVNHYAWLQENEGLDVLESVRRGSTERLVPILMTALTAVLGLVPLAFAGDQPGSELLSPLAVVVLGGLVTSTFLNLVVVPIGYAAIFGGRGFTRHQKGRIVLDGNANLIPQELNG